MVNTLRLVSPAPFGILGVDNQLHRLAELVANVGTLRHAIGFRQKHRGETMPVHGAVRRRARHADEAAVFDMVENKIDRPADISAILSAPRRTAGREKRHAGQRADRHVAAISTGAERAIVVLMLGQKTEPLCRRFAGGWREQCGPRFLRIGGRASRFIVSGRVLRCGKSQGTDQSWRTQPNRSAGGALSEKSTATQWSHKFLQFIATAK